MEIAGLAEIPQERGLEMHKAPILGKTVLTLRLNDVIIKNVTDVS